MHTLNHSHKPGGNSGNQTLHQISQMDACFLFLLNHHQLPLHCCAHFRAVFVGPPPPQWGTAAPSLRLRMPAGHELLLARWNASAGRIDFLPAPLLGARLRRCAGRGGVVVAVEGSGWQGRGGGVVWSLGGR